MTREVAALYSYLELDCLVSVVYHVAVDFFDRPHLYTELGDQHVVAGLARLRARYGADDRIPSQSSATPYTSRYSGSRALNLVTAKTTSHGCATGWWMLPRRSPNVRITPTSARFGSRRLAEPGKVHRENVLDCDGYRCFGRWSALGHPDVARRLRYTGGWTNRDCYRPHRNWPGLRPPLGRTRPAHSVVRP
jgi:hypothetical protein